MIFGFHAIHRAAIAAFAALPLVACGPDGNTQTSATDTSREGGAGTFDFYVLSLSWSPSYCATAGAKADRLQCGPKAHFAFIVHGLWPQYESGYPENCSTSQPKYVAESLAKRYEDLTPSPGLIRHEWLKHGTCSGLDQTSYLEKLRAARGRISIPRDFERMARNRQVSPQAIEDSFLKANKGLPREGIAVTCDRRYLREVRICLTRGLDFRPCEEVDRDSCRLKTVLVPAPG